MPKIPDFNKVDFSKVTDELMTNVKSFVSPGSVIPDEAKDKDPIAYRFSELKEMIQHLAKRHAEQAKEMVKMSNMLGELYQDVAKIHKVPKGHPKPKSPPPKKKPKEKD